MIANIAFGLPTLGIPLLGCFMAIAYQDTTWLLLLAPLLLFMEAGIGMILIAGIVVSFLVGR